MSDVRGPNDNWKVSTQCCDQLLGYYSKEPTATAQQFSEQMPNCLVKVWHFNGMDNDEEIWIPTAAYIGGKRNLAMVEKRIYLCD